MTDWLGLRAAVIAAVSAAMPPSVLATASVSWADGARPHARHRVLLSIVSAVFDDRDSALSRGGPQSLESMAVIVLQVTAESSYDTGDVDALWLIEQLRLGLRKVSVQEILLAAGVLVAVFPRTTRNIGGVIDGRALSVHAIELTLCASFALETTEDAGLVEHVEASGMLHDGADAIAVELALSDPSPEP